MDGIDKHEFDRLMVASRERLRALRARLPDTSTPEFRAEARRQALLLRDAPDEDEVMAFIEAVTDFGGE